jgi:DUF1365 family protein
VVEGAPLLLAEVNLERRPLSDTEIFRAFLRYGPMSARAWLLIRWQAIRILRLRIRYLRKPPLPAEETT